MKYSINPYNVLNTNRDVPRVSAAATWVANLIFAGGTTTVLTATQLAVGYGAVVVGAGAVTYNIVEALTPKPVKTTKGLLTNIREAAAPADIVYGQVRKGGVVTYLESTGDSNNFLHMFITLAGHEVEEIGDIYINDKKANFGTLLLAEYVIDAADGPDIDTYNAKILIKKFTGAANQNIYNTLNSDPYMALGSTGPNIPSTFTGKGVACLYVRLTYDSDVFTQGIPTFTAVVKGKKVKNLSGVEQTHPASANPALVIRDYLLNSYGLDTSEDTIDATSFGVAVSDCDDDITLSAEYGGGTQKRYTVDGVLSTSTSIQNNLNELVSACGGTLFYSGGKFKLVAGVYSSSVKTLTLEDLRSEITVSTRVSRRDNFNSVSGNFVNKDDDYTVADYETVTSTTFLEEDGGLKNPLELDFTLINDHARAQRLAKLALYRAREQMTVQAEFGLEAFDLEVGDTIALPLERYGWDNISGMPDGKEFEVVEWGLKVGEDAGDLRVMLTLKETSSAAFDWNAEETLLISNNTSLINSQDVPAVTLGSPVAGNTQNSDGTAIPFIDFSWSTGSAGQIDKYDFEWSSDGGTTYNTITTSGTRYTLSPTETGVTYLYRVTPYNVNGVAGTTVSGVTGVATVADSTTPNSPTGVSVAGGYRTTTVTWTEPTQNTDASTLTDLRYYRVYRGTTSNPTTEVGVVYSNRFTDGGLLDNTTYYYRIKAVDRTGNESAFSLEGSGTTNPELVDGAPGDDGARGAGRWYVSVTSLPTDSSGANTAFTAEIGDPVDGDQAWFYTGTISNPTGQNVWIYADGSPNGTWTEQEEFIDGNLIVSGSITGDRIAANQTITSPTISSGTIEAGTVKGGNLVNDSNQTSGNTTKGAYMNLTAGTFLFGEAAVDGEFIKWDGSTLNISGSAISATNLAGDLTGNVTGNVDGNVSGNAGAAGDVPLNATDGGNTVELTAGDASANITFAGGAGVSVNAVPTANNDTITISSNISDQTVSGTGNVTVNQSGNTFTVSANDSTGNLNNVTSNNALISFDNTNDAVSFNGNTPGSGNLRNSNVTLGNLASSNVTLGNLASDNTTLGNLASANSVSTLSFDSTVNGTLDINGNNITLGTNGLTTLNDNGNNATLARSSGSVNIDGNAANATNIRLTAEDTVNVNAGTRRLVLTNATATDNSERMRLDARLEYDIANDALSSNITGQAANIASQGNLATDNTTLGNLASSNTVLGNFATLNDLNDINGNAANATNVNVDATVADESLYLTGVDGQTNAERIEAATNITFNPANSVISANITGQAGSIASQGNLATDNTVLGNLATSNTTLGNFATLNDLNNINGNAANASNVNVDATVADESLYLAAVDGQTDAERIEAPTNIRVNPANSSITANITGQAANIASQGNLATSNAVVGTGNFRNLNALNYNVLNDLPTLGNLASANSLATLTGASTVNGTLDINGNSITLGTNGLTTFTDNANNTTLARSTGNVNIDGNAVNATNVRVDADNAGTAVHTIPFVNAAGNATDNSERLTISSKLTYQPSTGTLEADAFKTNTGITVNAFGNLAESNTTLGNLASSNAVVGTGNFRNLNSLNYNALTSLPTLGNLSSSNVILGNLASSNETIPTVNIQNADANEFNVTAGVLSHANTSPSDLGTNTNNNTFVFKAMDFGDGGHITGVRAVEIDSAGSAIEIIEDTVNSVFEQNIRAGSVNARELTSQSLTTDQATIGTAQIDALTAASATITNLTANEITATNIDTNVLNAQQMVSGRSLQVGDLAIDGTATPTTGAGMIVVGSNDAAANNNFIGTGAVAGDFAVGTADRYISWDAAEGQMTIKGSVDARSFTTAGTGTSEVYGTFQQEVLDLFSDWATHITIRDAATSTELADKDPWTDGTQLVMSNFDLDLKQLTEVFQRGNPGGTIELNQLDENGSTINGAVYEMRNFGVVNFGGQSVSASNISSFSTDADGTVTIVTTIDVTNNAEPLRVGDLIRGQSGFTPSSFSTARFVITSISADGLTVVARNFGPNESIGSDTGQNPIVSTTATTFGNVSQIKLYLLANVTTSSSATIGTYRTGVQYTVTVRPNTVGVSRVGDLTVAYDNSDTGSPTEITGGSGAYLSSSGDVVFGNTEEFVSFDVSSGVLTVQGEIVNFRSDFLQGEGPGFKELADPGNYNITGAFDPGWYCFVIVGGGGGGSYGEGGSAGGMAIWTMYHDGNSTTNVTVGSGGSGGVGGTAGNDSTFSYGGTIIARGNGGGVLGAAAGTSAMNLDPTNNNNMLFRSFNNNTAKGTAGATVQTGNTTRSSGGGGVCIPTIEAFDSSLSAASIGNNSFNRTGSAGGSMVGNADFVAVNNNSNTFTNEAVTNYVANAFGAPFVVGNIIGLGGDGKVTGGSAPSINKTAGDGGVFAGGGSSSEPNGGIPGNGGVGGGGGGSAGFSTGFGGAGGRGSFYWVKL